MSEAKGMLEGYPQPVAAEFDFLLAAAQDAVVLSENHNYWIDARDVSRPLGIPGVWPALRRSRVVAAPEDVFYLTCEELKQAARTLPQA